MSIDLPECRFEVDPALTRALRDAAERVISSHWHVLGPEVESFEREIAVFCGSGHCVGVATAQMRSSLHCVPKALHLPTEAPSRQVGTLPCFPGMTNEDAYGVIAVNRNHYMAPSDA